ncbi:hypothetical protein Tco_1016783 [Tanacetum coccineum]|uniref:Glycine-rich protein n=1 Tax=Tanacetum coccineum TaxID=301880 RepID=A0ABQ5FQY6_9ASTR
MVVVLNPNEGGGVWSSWSSSRGWCHGDDDDGEDGVGGHSGWRWWFRWRRWRVEESDSGDRVNREMGNLFAFGRKSPPEKFSGGGATVVAGSGGGGGWPDSLREKRERVVVSGKTEKLSGISFYIKLL